MQETNTRTDTRTDTVRTSERAAFEALDRANSAILADAARRSHAATGGLHDGADATDRPVVDLEIVIPAYDEESRLPATLAAAVEHLAGLSISSAVVVVDNGSVDRTSDLATAAQGNVPVYLLGCRRRGKGSAVRRGFATSRARWVGFMDADLATPMDTLDRVLPMLGRGSTVVIASRNAGEADRVVKQSAFRRAGGSVFRLAARSILPDVADSQCGFKFFDGAAVRAVLDDCSIDGFSFDVELLARMRRDGHDIVEVPVLWTDVPGSTFSPLKDGMRSFSDTVRIHRAAHRWPAAPSGSSL
jgi:dolichyl-phosphate beta-glucosyltransferase